MTKINKIYKCKRCNFSCKQFNDMSRHLNKTEICKLSLDACSFTKDELIKLSLIPYVNEKLTIDPKILKKKYNFLMTKNQFMDIFKNIEKNKLRICPLCNKKFEKKYELKEHVIIDCAKIIFDEDNQNQTNIDINTNINTNIINDINNDINNILLNNSIKKLDENISKKEENNNILINNQLNTNYNINITNNYYFDKPPTSFDEKWDTSHISNCEKIALILSIYSFTMTLDTLLKNKNNMNVIVDRESNSGIVYKKDKIEQMELEDLLEESFIKLYNHLMVFLDELKENNSYFIDINFFNEIKTKLRREFEIHTKYKPDIKKNDDKKELYNTMTDIYEKIKNESIKIIQNFNPNQSIEKIL
jgi:hypothetical protein